MEDPGEADKKQKTADPDRINIVRNIAGVAVQPVKYKGAYYALKRVSPNDSHAVCRQEIIIGSALKIAQCQHILHWFIVGVPGMELVSRRKRSLPISA